MPRLPESTWAIVAPDAILTVGATGIVNVATTIITGTGIGTENATVIGLPAATTETVVKENRIGTGVTEGAPVAIPLTVGIKGTLTALPGRAQHVLGNVAVIDPKSWRYSVIDSPSRDASHCRFQVIKFRVHFTVLYQDFKLKLFRQLA